jgi:CheY-like chemotaxis protein
LAAEHPLVFKVDESRRGRELHRSSRIDELGRECTANRVQKAGRLRATTYANKNRSLAKALIVEDEYLVAMEIERELRGLGFDVVGPATNLGQATRLASEEEDLAIGVLDISLRDDKSWPVARKLRDRGVPFFFLTGHLSGDLTLPSDLEQTEICHKPLDPHHLHDVIARLSR